MIINLEKYDCKIFRYNIESTHIRFANKIYYHFHQYNFLIEILST
jgi:hypothetical protein